MRLWLSSARLSQHVERLDVVDVVVVDPGVARDLADRVQGESADLTHALRDRVGHGKELVGVFVEQEVIIAKMGPLMCQWKFFVLR